MPNHEERKTVTRKRQRKDNDQIDGNRINQNEKKTENPKISFDQKPTEKRVRFKSNIPHTQRETRQRKRIDNGQFGEEKRDNPKFSSDQKAKEPRADFKSNETNTHNSTRKRKRETSKLILQEQILNDSPDKEFIVDELVLATVPGYCPWPARIANINGQTIVVEFFGTGQV